MSRTARPSAPELQVSKVDPVKARADAVVVGVCPNAVDGRPALAPGAESVDRAFGGGLADTLAALGAKGKAEEVTLLATGGTIAAPLVAAVGLGSSQPSAEQLRRAAGAGARRLTSLAASAVFGLAADARELGALAEGVLLGCYRFEQYHVGDSDGPGPLRSVTFTVGKPREHAVKAALSRAEAAAAAVNLARDWVNTAPSDLAPVRFAEEATSHARSAGLQVEVLDEKALAKGGYGGILGVGQGSTNPPRLVRLAYRPRRARAQLAFVGKGITFDSGGLSLKPTSGMTTMKCDMSGAAAVLAATVAVARLELPVGVTAWAPMAENMPSGNAQRPSDVLRMYGGKTVEVLNTDAEGRLVLADAMVRALEDEPDLVVDVATLTGACVVALGDRVFGVMAGDDRTRSRVCEAADQVGELGWPLPIPEGTRERLESKVADLANVATDRSGGALVAAAFLREFAGDGTPWAHLDIAGPAFNNGSAWGYTPRGGTGCAVRTLIGLAEQAAR